MSTLRIPQRSDSARGPGRSRVPLTLSALVCLVAAIPASPALAQNFAVHAEPAAAFWLDAPQSELFTPGFAFAVRPSMSIGRMVSVQLSYSVLMAGAGKGHDETGSAQSLMAGFRIRPFAMLQDPTVQLGGLFVDFNAGYVRTQDLNRWGFDAGLGYNIQATPTFAVGPVLRYGQIVQPDDRIGVDPNDAQYMTIGANFSFGPAPAAPPEPIAAPRQAPCPPVVECVPEEHLVILPGPPAPCQDDDSDGFCNIDDRCPLEAGVAAAVGCPLNPCGGAPLIVHVQFDFDSAEMPEASERTWTMDPVLEAVADAIEQDPTCRVCITGYTSEEGDTAYNQNLSEERAHAVQGYLANRGLDMSRIPSIGIGETCQMVPAASLGQNRRVEFRRLDEGELCTPICSE
jgi:outer membrane protein OmpA-like peptidoglycan-associated protein